jgi:hypothetical protein
MARGKRRFLSCFWVSGLILISVAGCDEPAVPHSPVTNQPGPPPPPPPLGQAPPDNTSAVGQQPPYQPSVAEASESPQPPSPIDASQRQMNREPHSDSHATRPTPNPSANRPLRFIAKLSAGTALPQTLPTGTAMGMSVDYVLQGELPASAAATVWVIESAQGEQAIPVQLNAKGNLMTFVNMRPEHGPFRSYLAVVYSDGREVPISRKIDMRSP